MSKEITDITARKIANTRGDDTIEVTVHAGAHSGTYSAPSGASTGVHEVHSMKDIEQAITLLETEIKPALLGHDVTLQKEIDQKLKDLDGTSSLERLGANTVLAVSIASAKAAAAANGLETYQYLRTLEDIKPSQEVPYLYINLINGGAHGEGGSPVQEHQIIPQTQDVRKAHEASVLVQDELRKLVESETGLSDIRIGDEGGLVFPVKSLWQPFEMLKSAIERANCDIEIAIGTDMAASYFYKGNQYELEGKSLDALGLSALYAKIIDKVPALSSFEDPFAEEAFSDFAGLLEERPELLVIGDDLTVTNKSRLEKAIEEGSINGLIVKPNQIGTLSDTLETMKLAREHDIHCIISHRSGTTSETFIADLAYAFGCYGLKAGAPTAKGRIEKYQRLIEISEND